MKKQTQPTVQHHMDRRLREKQSVQNQLKKMNLELALIETLSSARRGNEPHMKNITSLGQLSQRIRLANENIVMAEKEKELGQQWMKTKGVDVRSVMNCAKQSKLQTVEFRSVPPEKEIWQHIPFEQLTLKNQDQFLLKCKEVAVITALKTKRTNKRKNTRMRELRNKILVSKVQSITDVRSFEPQTTVLSVADRANIYLKTLTQTLNENRLDLFHCRVYEAMEGSRPNWLQTLVEQIEAIYFAQENKIDVVRSIMLHSLWCLERQFERILERSDTFSFLKNHYIFTHDVNVPVELHEGVELWGVAYLEYRAGRRSVLYQLIRKVQKGKIKKLFEKYDESLQSFEPEVCLQAEDYQIRDIFFSQLLLILNGSRIANNYIISQPEFADQPWLILHTLGIPRSSQTKNQKELAFWKAVEQLRRQYQEQKYHTCHIDNLAALNAYCQIIKYEQFRKYANDSSFSVVDYVHMLIMLYLNPQLSKLNEYLHIQLTCQKEVVSYAKSLRHNGEKRYQCYIEVLIGGQLIQNHSGVSEETIRYICTEMFESKEDIDEYDWRHLKELFKDFTVVLQNSQQKYARNNHIFQVMLEFALANIRRRDYKDYLFVAAKTNQWLENPEKEIEVLLQLQIEEALAREKLLADESQLQGRCIDAEQYDYGLHQKDVQLRKARQNVDKMLSYSKDPTKFSLFEFINDFCSLRDLLRDRMINRLQVFEDKWTYLSHKAQSNQDNIDLVLKYLTTSGSETAKLYLYYLKRVIERQELLHHLSSDLKGLMTQKRRFAKNFKILLEQYPQLKSLQLSNQILTQLQQRK